MTEDPNCIVGIIEIGNSHNDDPIVKIPGFIGRNLGNPEFDWGFMAIPHENTSNRTLFQSRGLFYGQLLGLFQTDEIRN